MRSLVEFWEIKFSMGFFILLVQLCSIRILLMGSRMNNRFGSFFTYLDQKFDLLKFYASTIPLVELAREFAKYLKHILSPSDIEGSVKFMSRFILGLLI